MTVKLVLGVPKLNAWVLFHQAYNLVSKREEAVFTETELSSQQYGVLMAMKYIESPVTVTDVANWLDRNTNSITMIVDRMEKDGLVRRVRDLRDRRAVRLVTTREGKEKFDRATKPGWEMIEKLLSCFSEEELQTFIHLIEKLRTKAFEELAPGDVMEEVKTNDVRNTARFLKRVNADA